MTSDNTTSQQIPSISGTSWAIITRTNKNKGTLQFKSDNSGTYTMEGNDTKHFYWWQYGASFWTQEKHIEKGWFSLIEGTLTGSENGTGKIIVAEQENGEVYVSAFTMSLMS